MNLSSSFLRLFTPARRALRRSLATAALTLVPVAAAVAWQLPARYLLRRCAAALHKAVPAAGPGVTDAFHVALVGRVRVGADGETMLPLGARWVFAPTRRTAAVALQPLGEMSRTWARGAEAPPGPAAPTLAEQVVLPALFADADPAALVARLAIDTEKRRLSLVGDEVADVIGALPGESGGSELWLDHDSHLPLRVSFRPKGGPPTRIDLLDWDRGPDGIPFPREIAIHENGRLVRSFEAEPARRMGGAEPARQMGGAEPARRMGSAEPARQMGGAEPARQMGGAVPARQMGGAEPASAAPGPAGAGGTQP